MKIKADKMCELEKFGFKKTENNCYYVKCCWLSSCDLRVRCDDRVISIRNYNNSNEESFHYEVLEEFYKLIKADMVEVEE